MPFRSTIEVLSTYQTTSMRRIKHAKACASTRDKRIICDENRPAILVFTLGSACAMLLKLYAILTS